MLLPPAGSNRDHHPEINLLLPSRREKQLPRAFPPGLLSREAHADARGAVRGALCPDPFPPAFFSLIALLLCPLCLLNVSTPGGISQSPSSPKVGSHIISSLIFVVHKYIFTPIYHKNTDYKP